MFVDGGGDVVLRMCRLHAFMLCVHSICVSRQPYILISMVLIIFADMFCSKLQTRLCKLEPFFSTQYVQHSYAVWSRWMTRHAQYMIFTL